jgi:hypothetical protein
MGSKLLPYFLIHKHAISQAATSASVVDKTAFSKLKPHKLCIQLVISFYFVSIGIPLSVCGNPVHQGYLPLTVTNIFGLPTQFVRTTVTNGHIYLLTPGWV